MKPGLILSVVAIVAGLAAIDRFLADLEATELANEARSLSIRGEQALASGRVDEAISLLQRAHGLVRENRGYQLQLARALLAKGRLDEAGANLRSLIDRDSNDGPSNLAMARLLVRSGNAQEAEAYYHRALYGKWPPNQDLQSVRMELADFLAKRGERKPLLAELLLLQDETAGNSAAQKKIARLFLTSGTPGRAVNLYRSAIAQHPGDIEAYMGLGEAELAAGDFHAAQVNYLDALRHKPGDPAILQKLRFTTALSTLDPTPRRLPSKEKYDRGMRILELARKELAQCAPGNALAQIAPEAVKEPITNELAEARLALAEEIWRARTQICGEPASDAGPLPLIMHKLMQ